MRAASVTFLLAILALPLSAQELQFAEFDSCSLESGEAIVDCRIGYRTFGELAADRGNVIIVPTWFGGSSGDWIGLLGGGVLDVSEFYVVVVDALANGVSSSPSNSESQWSDAFPEITIRDMVRTQHRLATEVLGLDEVYAVMGMSMGGMQSFEWAVLYPKFMEKVVPVIGSPRLAPYDIALWETEIAILALQRLCECDQAKAVLSGIGFLVGSTPTQQNERVPRDEVVARLQAGTERDLSGGKSQDIERQLEAMLATDVSWGFDGDMSRAAAAIEAEMLVIVGSTDHVVTPGPALEFAELVGAQILVLENDCGHGAPFCAAEQHNEAVWEFLGRGR